MPGILERATGGRFAYNVEPTEAAIRRAHMERIQSSIRLDTVRGQIREQTGQYDLSDPDGEELPLELGRELDLAGRDYRRRTREHAKGILRQGVEIVILGRAFRAIRVRPIIPPTL